MTIPAVAVRPATPADTDALVPVLVDAFFHGPVADWLVPDPTERRLIYHAYFTTVLRHGLDHGQVHTTGDRAGVAIWYPRLQPPPPPSLAHVRELEVATGRYAPVFSLLDTLFETHHPALPHHHLAYLAVTPDRQGQGIGAALLAAHHRRLDADGLPAYLEATSPRNRALYERAGYRVGTPIWIPDGPTFWRMWRPGVGTLPPGFPSQSTSMDDTATGSDTA
ncbi:GNAT family N-acetyltransferase [Micromonospora sp. WMMA1923]|uniref:GNAT family N-acetyltransferase n=1 Tax=Micromonospora sp. WMMA1923 TaxID=3404125 RepID=UPI003B93409F